MGAGALAEGLDLSTHFVVEAFEAWGLGPVRFEELVARSVGLEVLSTVAVAHGLDVDVVGVLGVHQHDVLMAALGCDGEAASEVGVVACRRLVGRDDLGDDGAVGGMGCWCGVVRVERVRVGGGVLGGALVAPGLVQVALGRGSGVGWVPSGYGTGEPGELEEALVERSLECGGGR